jgi:hypothetical protein
MMSQAALRPTPVPDVGSSSERRPIRVTQLHLHGDAHTKIPSPVNMSLATNCFGAVILRKWETQKMICSIQISESEFSSCTSEWYTNF